jgi:hypothetical protein
LEEAYGDQRKQDERYDCADPYLLPSSPTLDPLQTFLLPLSWAIAFLCCIILIIHCLCHTTVYNLSKYFQ